MSRIGRKIIEMPAGVTFKSDNGIITVAGPKGTLTQDYDSKVIKIKCEDNKIELSRVNELNETKAKHGLYRSLIANMVEGVSKGFVKTLEFSGVGYKAQKNGNKLTLSLGLSHQIDVVEADGITLEIPATTTIKVSGIDKQKVGQFASKIRDLRPVEPYHGYGIRYTDEKVIRKVGKTAAKGKK